MPCCVFSVYSGRHPSCLHTSIPPPHTYILTQLTHFPAAPKGPTWCKLLGCGQAQVQLGGDACEVSHAALEPARLHRRPEGCKGAQRHVLRHATQYTPSDRDAFLVTVCTPSPGDKAGNTRDARDSCGMWVATVLCRCRPFALLSWHGNSEQCSNSEQQLITQLRHDQGHSLTHLLGTREVSGQPIKGGAHEVLAQAPRTRHALLLTR